MNYVPGLEGVVVGETAISHVEGDIGRLSYRGVVIEDVIGMEYLDAVYLVLFGETPDEQISAELSRFMASHGRLTETERNLVRALPTDLHPMRMLQSIIPALELSEDRFPDESPDAVQGLMILARFPSLLAAIAARRGDRALPDLFDDEADYLARYLTMINGRAPTAKQLEVFRVVQLLQLEHSFNAGTFASRVVASTLASVPAVIAGGVGALSGVLHGGADESALRSAREMGAPEHAPAYVDAVLARKGRIMGMGHREYRVVDPRSGILKPMAVELCTGTGFEKDLNLLLALESAFNQRMAEQGKQLWANLEFYKGVVYQALGIDVPYFTTTFAMSRAVGWLAHLLESRQNNRILRPVAHYVGRAPGTQTGPSPRESVGSEKAG